VLLTAIDFMNLPSPNHFEQPAAVTETVNSPIRGKLAFDVILGILLPLLCMIFDPAGFFFNHPYQVFIYLFIGLEMVTLAIWLVRGQSFSNSGVAMIAGILFLGALFSLVVGLILLPLSLIFSLMLIGILGFTPFFTAVAFYRNGRCAVIQAYKQMRFITLTISFVFGMLLVTAPPSYAQWYTSQLVSQVIQAALQGDVQSATKATQKIKFIPWCFKGCLSEIVRDYYNSEEQQFSQQQILANTYREITGKDINEREGWLDSLGD
jgi:hypothetical protein